MSRKSRRQDVTHSLRATDDPQHFFRPPAGIRVVLIVFACGLTILALLAVIALVVL